MKTFTNQFSRLSLLALVLFTLMTSCTKEEMAKDLKNPTFYPEESLLPEDSPWQERFVDVTYQYNYYGEEFTVVHTIDQESNTIHKSEGDVEREDQLFGTEPESSKSIFYDVSNLGEEAVAVTYVFDSVEELEAFSGEDNSATKSCSYREVAGMATFQFFEHAGHYSRLNDLTKPPVQINNWNNVMSHNNDKISSFYASGHLNPNGPTGNGGWNGQVRLYHDVCYGGYQIHFGTMNTVLQVPNLAVIGPRYARGIHNDQTSSIKASWSY